MLSRSKNKLFFLLLAAILLALLIYLISFSFSIYPYQAGMAQGKVVIKDKTIWVDLAQTPEEKNKGLGGRENLADDEGMLFIFKEKTTPSFWMKDMNFPLDIIWLDDNIIVDISQNIQPHKNNQNLPVYRPSQAVNYVLEVNAGYVNKNNIKTGDRAEIQL